jgi:hypothetical protein
LTRIRTTTPLKTIFAFVGNAIAQCVTAIRAGTERNIEIITYAVAVATVHASPPIFKPTSIGFALWPSMKGSARALWSASIKPRESYPRCRAPSNLSRVMWLNKCQSFAMHAKLIPSYYLDRAAQTRSVRDGSPLRDLAEKLRALLFEPDGALSTLSSCAQNYIRDEAKRLAAVLQRSSSNVEGRNGYLSLRSHQLRGLDLPRKRQCFTTIDRGPYLLE